MDLHLHLSVAFRALDRKWGSAIDLETSEESLPCLPAVIDRPTTTFSSEEFLRKRRHVKPYSRVEEKTIENVKRKDSFANISSSRIPTLSEVEIVDSNTASVDSGSDEVCGTGTNLVEKFENCHSLQVKMGSNLDAALREKKPVKKILKQLKTSAKSYLDGKSWKKVKC